MRSLHDAAEVAERIRRGETLLIAGDEALLRALPEGKWIGGTIPYFMTETGVVFSHEQLHVVALPDTVHSVRTRAYTAADLPEIPKDYPRNGASLIVMPSHSEVHRTFARDCSSYRGIFDRPLMGWVSGIDLEESGTSTPKAIDGGSGVLWEDRAVVLHFELPEGVHAEVDTVNVFEQGDGDTITFPKTTFEVTACFVNGEPRRFSDYLSQHGIDTRLPLVADYMGARVNVSFRSIDLVHGKVELYAPVFPFVRYRIAKPVADFHRALAEELARRNLRPIYGCNCIHNYVHGDLEGKQIGDIVGPFTFGEVAYMLLNQTMVYLTIVPDG